MTADNTGTEPKMLVKDLVIPVEKQVGQLSQPNCAAVCISFGKNTSAKSVYLNTALSYGVDVDK